MTVKAELKTIKLICLSLSVLTLFLIGLGGYVRATGAGLACPDWPLCYGRAIPEDFSGGVFQEVFHRYVASLVSLITLGLAFFAYRRRERFPRLWRVCVILLVILASQVILGGLTVIMQLNPFIVTAHLIFGSVFFLLLMLTAIEKTTVVEVDKFTAADRRFRRVVLGITILCFFQLVLGGFVGSSGAALACPDIPFCFGKILPENATGQQAIQMLHRGTGVFLFALLLYALVAVFRGDGIARRSRGHMVGMVALVFIQINLGFSNVLHLIPVWLTVLHLVLAETILLGLASLYKKLNPALRVLVAEPERFMTEEQHEFGAQKVVNF